MSDIINLYIDHEDRKKLLNGIIDFAPVYDKNDQIIGKVKAFKDGESYDLHYCPLAVNVKDIEIII